MLPRDFLAIQISANLAELALLKCFVFMLMVQCNDACNIVKNDREKRWLRGLFDPLVLCVQILTLY